MQTLLSDDEIASLNVDLETCSRATSWRALEKSGLEKLAIASAFQTEGTVAIHGDADPTGRPDPLPRDRVPVRGDAGVQAAARGAAR